MNRLRGGARAIAVAVSILVGCVVALLPQPASSESFHPAMVFREPSIRRIEISPDGKWIAALMVHRGHYGITAQRRGEKATYPIHVSRYPIEGISWISDDDLLLSLTDVGLIPERTATLLHFHGDVGAPVADEIRINRPGMKIAALIRDEAVLWAGVNRGYSTVHRIPTRALLTSGEATSSGRNASGSIEEVARVRGMVDHWVIDTAGSVRAYSLREWDNGPNYSVGHRSGNTGSWRTLWQGREEDERRFVPVGVAVDGRTLIVIAYAGHDTRGIHEFDPEKLEYTRELFTDPNVDVEGVLLDPNDHHVVAATYKKGGIPQSFYLADNATKLLGDLEPSTASEAVVVVSSSLDRQYLILLAQGPTNPGTFYYYAKPSRTWAKLADKVSGVTPDVLVPMRAVHAKSKDGTDVEGFLTIPEPAGPRTLLPLVVVPHGGPIGAADGQGFDPLAQYLALSGFAVLQVNYRGSAGYGRDFTLAGHRQWGTGIEDDIDAVVQAVLDTGQIDPNRMCIAGGSYGGYSALISAIRFPRRYRCVYTQAGVTDIPLMFHGSDWSMNRYAQSQQRVEIGDPDEDYDYLSDISPVYRVADLQVPVLVAQGTDDERVDPEHAHRLRAMLIAHHKPFEWLEVEGGEHSPTAPEWVRYASALRQFLQKHLGAARPHVPRS